MMARLSHCPDRVLGVARHGRGHSRTSDLRAVARELEFAFEHLVPRSGVVQTNPKRAEGDVVFVKISYRELLRRSPR
jgi:hypothetical protein